MKSLNIISITVSPEILVVSIEWYSKYRELLSLLFPIPITFCSYLTGDEAVICERSAISDDREFTIRLEKSLQNKSV